MARTISGSVGMGGRNRPEDVVSVQQLLNRVPAGSGAPMPGLALDGVSGPKTITAIRSFQLHNFGAHGASGRIDPADGSMEKLNELDSLSHSFPAPVTARSGMVCPHGGRVTGTSSSGSPTLTTSDQFVVDGCAFGNAPCVKVQWLGSPGQPINQSSIGMCLNATNVPQGSVVFM